MPRLIGPLAFLALFFGPVWVARATPPHRRWLRTGHDVDAYTVGYCLGSFAIAVMWGLQVYEVPILWAAPAFLLAYIALFSAPAFLPGELFSRIRDRWSIARGARIYATGFVIGNIGVAIAIWL